MDESELKVLVSRVKANMRITKVIATRAVKTKSGDYFAGFSASWNSVQDDGAQGLDTLATEEGETGNGMTREEAKVAHHLLAMQADIAAHEAAMASGALSARACDDAVRSIRANYGKLIRMMLGDPPQAK